ncbi:putative E3 ubiquitin-protein ligase UNKL isoform X7 [Rhea pennata]|uniref:putative E3 ubiquitin-protein ligase UNKL isoform X7 n=1 Tax=Rhea pennata TaxID=8795 RepID=UPI002E2695EA
MPSVSKAVSRGGGPGGFPQTEQPTHYTYLKEFRTEQCPLFLQHKCTQHRPFTCFHWHFLNQRRRRPIRRRDGTFNYSPDVYCTKYDETTGICPDGDDCLYLHRTTGDTERKYHLRYYKTGTCIHETDARGHCVKNGLHCAFAHGPHDLRSPVYDIRELQAQETLQNGQLGCSEGIPDLQPGILASQAMIEKILSEDPRWQDTNFVLAGYKTEQCTKPPRLCRQGYACPHYHNNRDRRRNPRKFKYRSTPCPNVKHADEWGEPSRCENGDSCQYCHSRTEQQFHPENQLSVFSVVNQLASSITSSLASSVGSDSSSPTILSTVNAKALPFYPGSNTVESVIGSTLDVHFNDVNVASIDRELEDQESSDLGLASQRLLGGSAPVNIPGSLARSSSLHSSSSLSTSPLSSLSQSLSQSFVSSAMAPHQQQPQPLKSELSILGTSASSHNSLGLNGSIWDFVTGSFSPSPSPVLSNGTTPSINSSISGNELTQVRQELDDAKRKIKQWEDSWQQVKQACDAWQKEAQEAKERANVADADKQLALQKKEEVESKLKKLKEQFAACLSTTLSYMKNYGDIEKTSLPQLRSLQSRLRLDLGTVDENHRMGKVGRNLWRSSSPTSLLKQGHLEHVRQDRIQAVFHLRSKKCVVCQEGDRSIILPPCQHYVLCDNCAAKQEECPCCKKKKNQW